VEIWRCGHELVRAWGLLASLTPSLYRRRRRGDLAMSTAGRKLVRARGHMKSPVNPTFILTLIHCSSSPFFPAFYIARSAAAAWNLLCRRLESHRGHPELRRCHSDLHRCHPDSRRPTWIPLAFALIRPSPPPEVPPRPPIAISKVTIFSRLAYWARCAAAPFLLSLRSRHVYICLLIAFKKGL
jgi:hypothetical protein